MAEETQVKETKVEIVEEPVPKEIEYVAEGGWREKYIKDWLGVKLGRRAWMLQKHQEQHQSVQQIAEMARKGDFSGPTQESGGENGEGDDDVAVNVGNETHYHYQNEKTTAGGAAGAIGKAAVIAVALGAGPVGVALGGYMMYRAQQDNPTAAKDTDTWREFDLTPGKVTDIP